MPIYKFKHPSNKSWIEIVADTFNAALQKLKDLIKWES